MNQEPGERLFSLEDVRLFLRKKKKSLFQIFCIFACLGLTYNFLSCPKFRVKASFLEGKASLMQGDLKELVLFSMQSGSDARATAFMKARQVLKPLVQKLGLQVRVNQRNLFSKLYHRVVDNFTVIFRGDLKDIDDFFFENVLFLQEHSKDYFLRFENAQEFIVLDAHKKELGKGVIGSPFTIPELSFVLSKVPSSLKIKKDYSVNISTWLPIVEGLKKAVTIKPNKANGRLLELAIDERDRFRGVRILNTLMDEYKRYLIEDSNKTAEEQLAYLQKREEDIEKKLKQNLQEFTRYVAGRVGNRGFISSEDEMKFYMTPYFKYQSRLYELDCKEKCMSNKRSPFFLAPFLGSELASMAEEVWKYSEEKDALDLALSLSQKEESVSKNNKDPNFLEGLQKTRQQLVQTKKELAFQNSLKEEKPYHQNVEKNMEELEEVNQFITKIDTARSISSEESFPSIGAIPFWVDKLEKARDSQELPKLQEEFSSYLDNLSRLLKTRQVILEKRIANPHTVPKEFFGIDLETAKKLFVSYNGRLDHFELKLKQAEIIKQKIQEPYFEASSFSSVLEDVTSQKMMQTIASLHLQLKDEANVTEKEKGRIRKEIDFQKEILLNHLQELQKVDSLSLELVKEKLQALQQVMLDRIQQKLSLLQTQAEEYIEQEKQRVKEEKKVLQSRIEDLKVSMQDVPSCKEQESLFELQMEVGKKTIQAVTQMVESKTISNNLFQIQSSPFDYALPPLEPVVKRGILLSLLTGLLGVFLGFFVLFVKELFKGLPVSNHTLQVLRQKIIGSLSSSSEERKLEALPDEDLETLRKAAFFLEENISFPTVVSLLHPHGVNYSFPLAHLLAKRGYKVLIINCDLQNPYRKKEDIGLLSVLEQKVQKLPFQQQDGFDYLPAGGSSKFSVEWFTSKAFKEFLSSRKKEYDILFLYSRAALPFVESKVFLQFSDKVLVTLEEENIETLQPFMDWSYYEGRYRLAFLRSGC